MKRKILLLITILFLTVSLTSCKKEISDNQKFSEEYSQVPEYNLFVYRSDSEIIKILENGTGLVYLGFPECQWCQAYVPILNEIADTEGLDKIYYHNILEERKNNTESYQKIVSLLSDYLQYDNEGSKRIYVPAVIAVSKGKIVGFNDESSYDTLGYDNPKDYWTEERTKQLKLKLTEMVNQVADNKCSDCNK